MSPHTHIMPAPPPPSLPLIRFRLTFRAHEALHLPAYTGSAWRGAFGYALKRLVELVGQRGLGTDRGALQSLDVGQQTDDGHWQTIYRPGGMFTPLPPIMPVPPPLPEWIKVRLLTPLYLSHENRLVSQDRFRFALLFPVCYGAFRC
ncbi:MAG: hypothetical protein EKK69_11965 [Candidatus Competibacteraceae bacterium]|nr:MAG: hypothetical protein EKK69_11965 [Candidatus Competibacteraceae bacterium]